tara:strand:+ start:421 stop:765 length:345 start_codon:yes stop_codon:yes gene_type:complete
MTPGLVHRLIVLLFTPSDCSETHPIIASYSLSFPGAAGDFFSIIILPVLEKSTESCFLQENSTESDVKHTQKSPAAPSDAPKFSLEICTKHFDQICIKTSLPLICIKNFAPRGK